MKTDPELEFEKLYRDYGPALYRFSYALTGSCSEAEDVVQEVFLAAFKGRARFRRQASIRTWLFRIAYFQARKTRQRAKRESQLNDDLTVNAPPTDSKVMLEQALQALPSRLKDPFLMVKLEQFTSREAAEILGIPEGTVKYQVFEAVQQLRRTLDPSVSLQEESTHVM